MSSSSTQSRIQIIHAYRHLYREALHAVQYASPARFTLRDRLRRGFRQSNDFNQQRIDNTLEFLRGATRENGIEHRILKNILFVWYTQNRRVTFLNNGPLHSLRSKIQTHQQHYAHFDRTLHMLNESLPIYMKKKPVSKKRSRGKRNRQSKVDSFFAAYPAFDYDSTAPIFEEFYRMCDFFGWNSKIYKDEKDSARDQFKDAMVEDFNDLYGTDVDDIRAWHTLCRTLYIVPPPEEIEQCRKRIKSTHVNLVDLVETRHTGVPVEVFASLDELRGYTIATAKYFPKHSAYAGGVLKYLLREILNQRD
ncbi:MAG: hypothetical protein M1837_006871 [Sclerophora amabilis]|nr:MAG: hypothetical protein M1837_006871 [Sclerophora amabilis]